MNVNCENILERFLVFDPATLYEAAGLRGMVDPSIRPAWPGARWLKSANGRQFCPSLGKSLPSPQLLCTPAWKKKDG